MTCMSGASLQANIKANIKANLKGSVAPSPTIALVAYYTVDGAPEGSLVSIEFGRDTRYGSKTGVVLAGGSQPVVIPVAGMLAKTTYHMRAKVVARGRRVIYDRDHTFRTGALPASVVPTISVKGSSSTGGLELLCRLDHQRAALVSDLAGNVLWYYQPPEAQLWEGYPFPIKQLPNGNMLMVVTNIYRQDAGPPQPGVKRHSLMREIDLGGRVIREVTLRAINAYLKWPDPIVYFHHDVERTPDGNFVLLGQVRRKMTVYGYPKPGLNRNVEVVGDVLVVLNPKLVPVWTWSAFDHLNVNRHPVVPPPPKPPAKTPPLDWTHCNAVSSTPDGNLLLSSRHQSWVLKIDYAKGRGTGKIFWKLGPDGDFTPAHKPFAWFQNQHAAAVGSNNQQGKITTISLFDNHGATLKPVWPGQCSQGMILRIDEGKKTVAVDFVSPVGYSWWGGNATPLSTANVEVCSANDAALGAADPYPSVINELDPDGNQVWSMVVGGAPGHSPGGFLYRGYRIPSLYPSPLADL